MKKKKVKIGYWYWSDEDLFNPMEIKMTKVAVASIVGALVCFVALLTSCTIISPGYVGIRITLGSPHAQELQQGIHFVYPFFFDRVINVDTRLRSYEIENADSSSHDLQKIFTNVSIQHSLTASLAAETYAAIGTLDSIDANVLRQAVEESMKAVTAQYTAEELIKKREQVKEKLTAAIKNYIQHTLHDKNPEIEHAVKIANVALTNFAFSEEFNHSIEQKVKAEQDALREENDKKKRITAAEAKAKEQTLEADAIAYKVEMESKARADAIKREAEALAQNPNLIKLRSVEKWNGVLPTFMTGNSPLPFIEVPASGK